MDLEKENASINAVDKVKNITEKVEKVENIVSTCTKTNKTKESKSLIKKCSLFFISILLVTVFIISGTFFTLFLKFQNETFIKISFLPPTTFYHSISQVIFSYFAMFILIIPTFCQKNENINNRRLLYIIPTFCNLIGTFCICFAIYFTYASVFQMFTSLIVIYVEILSIIFFKKKITFYTMTGLIFVTIGTVVVGLSTSIYIPIINEEVGGNNEYSTTYNHFVAILLLCIGEFGYASQYVVEEYILKKYDNVEKWEVLGYEGFYGLGITSFVLLIVSLTTKNIDNGGEVLLECLLSPILFVFIVGFIFVVMIKLTVGLHITKKFSAATRSNIDNIRMISIWLVQLLRGREIFSYFRLIGFTGIVFGNLIYFKILSIDSCCKVVKFLTSKGKEEEIEEEKEIEVDTTNNIQEGKINEKDNKEKEEEINDENENNNEEISETPDKSEENIRMKVGSVM